MGLQDQPSSELPLLGAYEVRLADIAAAIIV
jgi:hypothetical protein